MARWIVEHLEHNGTINERIEPENLSFTMAVDEPGEISYEISLSNPAMRDDIIGPYRTDFRLLRDNLVIMAGMHTMMNVGIESEHVKIGGKDWLHYLQRRHFPLNPDPGYPYSPTRHTYDYVIGTPPKGFVYYINDVEPVDVIQDMLDVVLARPHSLALTYDMPATGVPLDHYEIPLGDTEWMYDKIKTLSDMDPGGFDFWVTPGKVLTISSPHRYAEAVADDPVLANYTITKDNIVSGTLEFTNTGPSSTHLLGQGHGNGTDLWVARGYTASEQTYRRLDNTFAVQDSIRDRGAIAKLTQARLAFELNPVHEIPIQVFPETIPHFWTLFKPGYAVWVDIDLEAHHIDSAQQIVRMECSVDNEENELVALQLNQIYPAGQPQLEEG